MTIQHAHSAPSARERQPIVSAAAVSVQGTAFYRLVAAAFQDLVKDPSVFVADVDGDALYAAYLAAFPEGTNPLFRKNTEHDCSCCKHFIRRAGVVVAIDGGAIRTVWDRAAESAPEPYRTVAGILRDTVRAAGIRDLFRVGANETCFGAAQTRSLDAETQLAVTWNHLHTGEVPRALRVAMPDTVRGELTAEQLWDVPLRSADEFNLNAVAKAANEAVKAANEENFVETTRTAAHVRVETTLEVVKHVIESKLADEAAAQRRADNKIRKEKLLAVLAEKQDGKLSEMSERELKKQIAELDE